MAPPDRLGRYVIEAELGRGAMGRVYRAHDPAIDRLVALKTIHLPDGLSERERHEAIERFAREARAAGRLSHPNIVTVYDTGIDPTVGAFIAMEHVTGTGLDKFVRSGQLLDRPRAVHILAQVAEALAYAHSQGVVHRDIKPANLLLVDNRIVKIADFGLAKTAGASVTQDGALLGSPNYMSPEQIRGQALDGRSDLFSLGVVAYEMLTGRLPFGGTSISTVIYRIMNEVAADPGLGDDPESMKLRAVLERAMAKKPEDRFATGSELAAALNEAVPAAAGISSPGRISVPGTFALPKSMRPAPEPSRADNTPTIVSGSGLAGAPARGGVAGAGPARGGVAGAGTHGPAGRETIPVPPDLRARARGSRGAAATAGTRAATGVSASRRRSRAPLILASLFLLLVAVGILGYLAFERDLIRTARLGVGAPSRAPEGTTPPAAPTPPVSTSDAAARPGAAGSAPDRPAGGPVPPGPSGPGGSIVLLSNPPGAEYFVDGVRLADSRLAAPEEGAIVELVARAGCMEASRRVQRADAGTTIVMALQPAEVLAQVTSTPAGAKVSVDGEAKGSAPLSLKLDACREHRLDLTLAGHRPVRRDLPLVAGRLEMTGPVEVQMTPTPPGVLIVPKPPFAVDMTIDGGRRVEPGSRLTMPPGKHRLRLVNRDMLYEATLEVDVAEGTEAAPRPDFPGVARLTVRSQPGNATIAVERGALKRDLGAPPIFAEQVASGTYIVRCTFLHNGEVQERRVDLTAGENPALVFVAGKPPGSGSP